MAFIKIKKIKKRLDHVLGYVKNTDKVLNESYGEIYNDLHNVLEYAEADYKTENRYFVSGINCNSENAYEQMQITKRAFGKADGIIGYHIIHSFNEGEVTPELAHKIGMELATELFGDRFEVVVATHLNTKHYHNHIILNSVSFKDGKKYYDNHESYALMRKISNDICKEYGLKTMEEKICKKSKINYNNFYKKYSSKNNYQNTAKKDLDLAIAQAFSFEDFKQLMKKMGYEIIFRPKMSIRCEPYKRNIRVERTFGEEYSIENIKKRILEEKSFRVPFIEAYKIKKSNNYKYKGKYKKTKAKGFKALYLHYCYLLKVFPNTKNINKRLPASIRAEVKRMEEISQEAIFLNKNNIETDEELKKYKVDLENELKALLSKRENLWTLRNKIEDEISKGEMCNDIAQISEKIKTIRHEIKMCEDITKRIPKMKENLKEINESRKNKNRKEKNKDEYCIE